MVANSDLSAFAADSKCVRYSSSWGHVTQAQMLVSIKARAEVLILAHVAERTRLPVGGCSVAAGAKNSNKWDRPNPNCSKQQIIDRSA